MDDGLSTPRRGSHAGLAPAKPIAGTALAEALIKRYESLKIL